MTPRSRKRLHFLHDWTRWEEYVWTGTTGYWWQEQSAWKEIVTRQQKRHCETCGLIQERDI